ncbi:hypothetical protein [uncultured Chryseobacterium sp.]|uniref:hypothetical protein n=1 Tax=uncultured Chryseobacterium sp. TaxID=259322 RepID=UPI00374823C3
MKNFLIYRNVIFSISIIIVTFIIIVTIQLINNESSILFEIDFKDKAEQISAFASLIGSFLSFLSILFVLYTIFFQKNESMIANNQKDEEENIDLKRRLNLLTNQIDSFIDSLEQTNNQITIYIEQEKKHPSQMHTLYFSVNKNFSRLINNDPQIVYNALKTFNNQSNFEILFSELYKNIDFYNDLIIELKSNNKAYKRDKVKQFEKITEEILEVYDLKVKLISSYRKEFPWIYNTKPWVEKTNKSLYKYYKYLEECDKKKVQFDLDFVNKDIFEEFINGALFTIQATGIDKYGGLKILTKLSHVRKHLTFAKSNVYVYINDLEYYQKKYLMKNSESIIELKLINEKIKTLLL